MINVFINVNPVTAENLATSWVSYNSDQQVPVVFQVQDGGQFPVIISELIHTTNKGVVFAGVHQDTHKKVRGYCTFNNANGRNWVRYVDTPPPK